MPSESTILCNTAGIRHASCSGSSVVCSKLALSLAQLERVLKPLRQFCPPCLWKRMAASCSAWRVFHSPRTRPSAMHSSATTTDRVRTGRWSSHSSSRSRSGFRVVRGRVTLAAVSSSFDINTWLVFRGRLSGHSHTLFTPTLL